MKSVTGNTDECTTACGSVVINDKLTTVNIEPVATSRSIGITLEPSRYPSKSSSLSLEMINLPWYKSKRNIPPLLCFFAVFVMYIVRFSFSQASIPMSLAYEWSQLRLSWIVSAFYIGYLPSQLIGASASKAWGGKPVVAVGLILSCFGSICIPILAQFYFLVLCFRVVMGIGQGFMYPAMTELLSHWIIPFEKAFWMNFSWSGGQVGTIFCLGIYPILNELFGWRFPFFLFGAVGLLWLYLWISLIWETPQSHPTLSLQEKIILETFPPRSVEKSSFGSEDIQKTPRFSSSKIIPWGLLIRSWQIYPLMLLYFGYNWPFYLMINSLPTYLQTVLGFRSSKQGLLSMLPYIFLWLSLIISGLFSDWLIRKQKIPLWVQRKGMVFLGLIPSALILIFLSNFSGSVLTTLIAINIAVSLPGVSMSGFSPVPLDLSPEYAAAISSLCNVVGSTAGIICPIVTGLILESASCPANDSTGGVVPHACKLGWFLAFKIGGGIYIFVVLVWIFFASFRPISFAVK